MKKILLATAIVLAASAGILFLRSPARAAHPLRDLDGAVHGSIEKSETALTALLFLGTACPISRQYAPEIERICSEFKSQGVGCFLVYPEQDLTASALKAHLNDFGHTSPAILDPALDLVRYAGATITPEAVVFSRSGSLLYRGRIDDRYRELGRPRPEVGIHDLRNALEDAASGGSVANPRTDAVGCYIEGL
jgi:hypothetical protein